MRFYGLSLLEVESMLAEDEEMLWQAIDVIEARETLIALQVSAFPNLKKDRQESIHRKLHKMAYPSNYEKPVQITFEQMAKLVNG